MAELLRLLVAVRGGYSPSWFPLETAKLCARLDQLTRMVQEVTRADWVNVVLTAAPLFLLVGFWIVMMRQMKLKGKNQ